MMNKITTTFQPDNNWLVPSRFSSRPLLHSLVGLVVLALLLSSLGWLSQSDLFFFQVGAALLILATAGVRFCWTVGFSVWAGLLSLTFGTVFILLIALTSSGMYVWAVAIALSWMGIFALDTALSQSIDNLREMELRYSQVFWILMLVCTISVVAGGTVPLLLKA